MPKLRLHVAYDGRLSFYCHPDGLDRERAFHDRLARRLGITAEPTITEMELPSPSNSGLRAKRINQSRQSYEKALNGKRNLAQVVQYFRDIGEPRKKCSIIKYIRQHGWECRLSEPIPRATNRVSVKEYSR